ncbi:hypothetical protein [Streptomyces chumphonensis]|uniref:hypothetical protein n=1 Tax=Streptomyces chumphonensis TaxID=1214925 RepID=UPI003D7276C1
MLSSRKTASLTVAAALAGTLALTLVGTAGADPSRPAPAPAAPAAAPVAERGAAPLAEEARRLDLMGDGVSSVMELVEDVLEADPVAGYDMREHREEVLAELRDLELSFTAPGAGQWRQPTAVPSAPPSGLPTCLPVSLPPGAPEVPLPLPTCDAPSAPAGSQGAAAVPAAQAPKDALDDLRAALDRLFDALPEQDPDGLTEPLAEVVAAAARLVTELLPPDLGTARS